PDTLEWEDSEYGFTDWLHWALSDRLELFYRDFRWRGWEQDTRMLPGDRAWSISPPLFVKGEAAGERDRRDVPVDALWRLQLDLQRQLEGVPDGSVIKITKM
ncbi:MAG: DUF2625 family protein, partial [Archangium sp.]|nr:DUF2625 family protein [Archangium sp.]